MNVKYVTVPKCVDCQKDCEKADYVFFGESKVCKHGKGFIICGIAPEKRKPLMSDGTLPLTNGEMSELCEIMGYQNICKIFYDNKLHFKCFDKGWGIITDVKAIAYLLERFELIKED
ncbi:MAG TPA: hypothetical protein PK151_04350 [Caldisericia bacterium]|nr:hypothetical protein [Caldisericia bacterium]